MYTYIKYTSLHSPSGACQTRSVDTRLKIAHAVQYVRLYLRCDHRCYPKTMDPFILRGNLNVRVVYSQYKQTVNSTATNCKMGETPITVERLLGYKGMQDSLVKNTRSWTRILTRISVVGIPILFDRNAGDISRLWALSSCCTLLRLTIIVLDEV